MADKKIFVTTEIRKDQKACLEEISRVEERSVSYLIRDAVKEYMLKNYPDVVSTIESKE